MLHKQFLCAVSVIHAMNDKQDMRRERSIIEFTPGTYLSKHDDSLDLENIHF